MNTKQGLRRSGIGAAVAATCLLALSACGAGVVTQKDVEGQIKEQFGSEFEKLEKVDCPDDLTAEVDSTMTCTLSGDGTDYKVDVKVTSVKGDDVLFDMEVK